jgi:hypothetical protein
MKATYDLPIRQNFTSLTEARAHRQVVGTLTQQLEIARQTSADLREADKVEVGKVPSELYKDLASGEGHVIMLSQPEDKPLAAAELKYDPKSGNLTSLEIDYGNGSKLHQVRSTYKFEQDGVTTFFRHDEARGVLTIMDGETDVPRIFGDADPAKLTAGTIQSNSTIFIY